MGVQIHEGPKRVQKGVQMERSTFVLTLFSFELNRG